MLKLPGTNKLNNIESQRGQALLIILLVMAVSLTIVLSVVSRSVTEVSISGVEEDALRAFSAAEAGIEEALLTRTSTGPISLDPAVSYEATVDESADTDRAFKYPESLKSGETATFWLVSHASDNQLTCSAGKPCFTGNQFQICWGSPSVAHSEEPAIEVLLFYDASPGQDAVGSGNYADVEVMRYAVNRNATAYGDGFDSTGISSGCTIEGTAFEFRKAINWNGPNSFPPCRNTRGCVLVAKVRSYYNTVEQPIGIRLPNPNQDLPAQGIQISSTGSAGESNRKVNVFQGYPEPPSVFDAALFSMEDLLK